jgi:hypothetical protein
VGVDECEWSCKGWLEMDVSSSSIQWHIRSVITVMSFGISSLLAFEVYLVDEC